MFFDEVLKDNHMYARLWGRSCIGTHVEHYAPLVCKCQFSMVAVLGLNEGIVAAKVVEGLLVSPSVSYSCSLLMHAMSTPYPGPQSVLVIDNTWVHHYEQIEDLLRGHHV